MGVRKEQAAQTSCAMHNANQARARLAELARAAHTQRQFLPSCILATWWVNRCQKTFPVNEAAEGGRLLLLQSFAFLPAHWWMVLPTALSGLLSGDESHGMSCTVFKHSDETGGFGMERIQLSPAKTMHRAQMWWIVGQEEKKII